MSEQFANLASTTLAAGYTAGSGSLSVVSAAGWPTSGTFTLVIRDQASKAIKLLFRVTSVSGTTFSGASEGADASANPGDLVDGTMVTVASLAQFKTDILASVPASSGFIQSLTAPVAANFSQKNFNVGSGVVSSQFNLSSPVTAISILQHDPSATNNMIALAKAKINALFTITLGFSFFASASNAQAGLWIADGTAGPNMRVFVVQNGFGIRDSLFTNYTSFGGDAYGPIGQPVIGGPLIWLRVQETASARISSISTDGVNWAQFGTQSNTANFTTTQYGFGLAARTAGGNTADAMMTVYHFSETTP